MTTPEQPSMPQQSEQTHSPTGYGHPQPGWPAAPAWPALAAAPKGWPTSAKVVTGTAAAALVIGGTALTTWALTGNSTNTTAPTASPSTWSAPTPAPGVTTVAPSPARTYSAYDEMKAREVWQQLGKPTRDQTCRTYRLVNRTAMVDAIGESLYKVNGITADPGALYDLVLVKECGNNTGI
ncbi:hypothetical protein OG730_09935 [Streptomyces sp. NBC_01298]|uniref:hypothetical protein n=1 Tax=Streptomyces sp. NBC_01298 TaxID=2903817 RepID=UPI002E0EBE37|nr:hypothetical protein OG730_09935 [Streptomyces sp. NBC_01298]